MFYELDADGHFISDAISMEGLEYWTDKPPPQPCDRPRFVGGIWTDDGPAPIDPEVAREIWKAGRAAQVEAIRVTTQAGNTFDGDEVSQSRMSRAIIALGTTPGGTVNWILADNTVVDVTAAELTEALALAGAAQAAIWVAP